jgi:GNAT superfamily N-acetyltransferase
MIYIPFSKYVMKDVEVKNKIFKICSAIGPDCVRDFINIIRVLENDNDSYTGMYFIIIENIITSVAMVLGDLIVRIYTIPSARKKGYATKLLKVITFLVPSTQAVVTQEVLPLFIKIGFTPRFKNKINKDNTIDLIYNKKYKGKNIALVPPKEQTDIAIKMFKLCHFPSS